MGSSRQILYCGLDLGDSIQCKENQKSVCGVVLIDTLSVYEDLFGNGGDGVWMELAVNAF